MPLTTNQQTFLDNYVRKHSIKGKGKKKRAANFVPARDAAVQQLALMQAVPGYAGFQNELNAIDTQAEELTFSRATRAADDLTQRMKQAQLDFLNNGVVEVTSKINSFNLLRVAGLHEEIDAIVGPGGTAAALLPQLAPIPGPDLLPPDTSDPTSDAARGVTDWAGKITNVIQAKRRSIVEAGKMVAAANKRLVELRTKSTAGNTQSTQIVAKLAALRQSWLPTVPNAPLTQAQTLYDAKVQHVDVVPTLDPNAPDIAPSPPRIDATATAVVNQLTLASTTLANQLTLAQQQVTQAVQALLTTLPKNSPAFEGATDALNLLQTAPVLNVPVNPPRDFDGAAFFTGPLAAVATAPVKNASQFAQQEKVAERALLAEVQQQGYAPDSDEVFDLKLKTTKDFFNEYCEAVGWNPTAVDPEEKARAMAVAQGCVKAVRTLGADRIVAKGQPVTLGGQQYVNGRFLAQGGMGEVWEYEDATDPTKKIVLKNALRLTDHDRADLQKEVKSHRQLMKQPPGTPGRENIVELKGAIVGDDGQLYVAMEKVEAGDLEQNRTGASVASDVGVLPEQIRQLFNQRTAKQAIEGLKYLRDQNMVHFDLKGANIMMAGDGSVKVADFGSAAFGTNTAGNVPANKMGGTTRGYEAPETFDQQGSKSHQFDTHSMGKVIEIMQTGNDAPGEQGPLTGALKRLKEAMANPDPAQRPSLESVLATSYFKNLDEYNDAKLQQLTVLTSKYAKALDIDGPAVFNHFMTHDLAFTGPLTFTPNTYKDLIGISKETLRLREKTRRQLVAEKEDPNTDPARVTAIDLEIKTIADQMTVLRHIPKRFGQSDQAKQIGEQIRVLSSDIMKERERRGG